jgi:hypothetical protein
MSEQQIIRFPLPKLYECIPTIISQGYQKTGNKFSVRVVGAKGHVAKVVVACEGEQVSLNWIQLKSFTNHDDSLRDDVVDFIFHSQKHGVHVSVRN